MFTNQFDNFLDQFDPLKSASHFPSFVPENDLANLAYFEAVHPEKVAEVKKALADQFDEENLPEPSDVPPEEREPLVKAKNWVPVQKRSRGFQSRQSYNGVKIIANDEVQHQLLETIFNLLVKVYSVNQKLQIAHYEVRVKKELCPELTSKEQIKVLTGDFLENLDNQIRSKRFDYTEAGNRRRLGYISEIAINPETGNVHVHLYVLATRAKNFFFPFKKVLESLSENVSVYLNYKKNDRLFMSSDDHNFCQAFHHISYIAKNEGQNFIDKEVRTFRYNFRKLTNNSVPLKSVDELVADSKHQYELQKASWVRLKAAKAFDKCASALAKAKQSVYGNLDVKSFVAKLKESFVPSSEDSIVKFYAFFADSFARLSEATLSSGFGADVVKTVSKLGNCLQFFNFVDSPVGNSRQSRPPSLIQ
jgi:hypothetical protein